MGDKPQDELMKSMHALYINSDYSDLTIVCGETKHQVHKAIVCPRSEFFKNSVKKGFQEALSGEITLAEDDPEIIRLMLHYLYHLDYPHVSQEERAPAATYMSTGWKFGPEYCDDFSDDSGNEVVHNTFIDADGLPLITHARVYAIAEKYQVMGLKALAAKKFSERVRDARTSQDFSQAVREVYTSTVDSDRGLRDFVVDTLFKDSGLVNQKEIQDLLQETPLAYDLLMHVHENRRW